MNLQPDKERAALLQKLESSRGIEDIMAIGYALLGNPMVAFDTSYRLFARTENTVNDDPLWNELVELGTFSHETVDFFRAELFMDEVAYSGMLSSLKSKELKYDRINGKLFDDNHVHIGNLCVVACYRPLEPGDYGLMAAMCTALTAELRRGTLYRNSERDEQERAVALLLDGNLHPDTPEFEKIHALEQAQRPNLYVAVVDISGYDHTLHHLRYFRDMLQNLPGEYPCFLYQNHIVILISTECALAAQRDLRVLYDFFARHNLIAGVSSRFTDLFKLRAHFLQALHALARGTDSHYDPRMCLYDDFKVDHFLDTLRDKPELDALADPIVEAICGYDQAHATTCFETIYRYLLYGKDTALTAGKLGVTEASLETELQTLTERFNIDWRNGTRLAGLLLAMKIKRAT